MLGTFLKSKFCNRMWLDVSPWVFWLVLFLPLFLMIREVLVLMGKQVSFPLPLAFASIYIYIYTHPEAYIY